VARCSNVLFEGGEDTFGRGVEAGPSLPALERALLGEDAGVRRAQVLLRFEGSSQQCSKELRCNRPNGGSQIEQYEPHCGRRVVRQSLVDRIGNASAGATQAVAMISAGKR
jgi:hypothetical protein